MSKKHIRSFQQIDQANTGNYLFALPEIDTSRDTAVYLRQSRRKADKKNGESRQMQEALRIFAMKLRRQDTMEHIQVYDEGAGKSGRLRIDERPELNRLWQDLKSGVIGQVIIAREDRLFRDEHGDQSGAFTRLAQALDIQVFIPPFQASGELDEYGAVVYYDFKVHDHLKAFKRKMDISADFLSGHVKYMIAARHNKSRRGAYDGRNLPPGLVLERHAPKDTRRPVLYEPWVKTMQWVFEKAEEFNWVAAAIMREIEHMPYLFPEPSEDDKAKYEFCTALHHCEGGGYKPKFVGTLMFWFTNVHLIGWWTIKMKSSDTVEVLVGNHPAVLDEALFRRCYEYNTGYTLEGEEVLQPRRKRIRQIRKHNSPEALLHGCISSPGALGVFTHVLRGKPRYIAHKKNSANLPELMFSIYAEWIDALVVDRLRELLASDKMIADRVKGYLEALLECQTKENGSIEDQIAEIDRKLAVSRRRLTILNNELGSTKEEDELAISLSRTIKGLTKQREQLVMKQSSTTIVDGPTEVKEFYDTLSGFEAKWPKLSLGKKQKLLDLITHTIELDMKTPHWMSLRVKWLDAVTPRPDIALVWRAYCSQVDRITTPEEIAVIKDAWPTMTVWSDVLMRIPTRTYQYLKTMASNLGVKKQSGCVARADFPATACWADLYILPDASDVLQLIEQAIAICKAEKKGAHAFWMCNATPEGLLEELKARLGLSNDFNDVNSVIPKTMATSAPIRSLTCSIK